MSEWHPHPQEGQVKKRKMQFPFNSTWSLSFRGKKLQAKSRVKRHLGSPYIKHHKSCDRAPKHVKRQPCKNSCTKQFKTYANQKDLHLGVSSFYPRIIFGWLLICCCPRLQVGSMRPLACAGFVGGQLVVCGHLAFALPQSSMSQQMGLVCRPYRDRGCTFLGDS